MGSRAIIHVAQACSCYNEGTNHDVFGVNNTLSEETLIANALDNEKF